MNKIICDVCGTDYPETAEQCPICGCANAGEQTAAGIDALEGEDRAARSYVKGGRFSKKNVNKRLKSMGAQPGYAESESVPEPEYDDEDLTEDQEPEEEEQGSNLGLIIIVLILLLAIAAVSAYIAVSIFGLGGSDKPVIDNKPGTSTTAPTTEQLPENTGVACTDLALSDVDIYLDTKGGTWLLSAELAPENTTDTLTFASTDENVVTVDPVTGLVTAVGSGEASIIVTCGDVVRDCPVKCEFAEAPEETIAPEDPTEETTEPVEDFELELDKQDFTLFKVGATCDIYSGELKASEITWTTDNEDVATIKDGIVTAVGNGRTRVYGEYNGTKVSCWVSCKLPEEETTAPTEEETTEPEQTGESYTLMINGHVSPYGDEENAEVSITVGESFRLTVEDDQGLRQDVTWKASREGICTVEGRTVTGEAAGKVTLTAKLGDQTFKCVIIVK